MPVNPFHARCSHFLGAFGGRRFPGQRRCGMLGRAWVGGVRLVDAASDPRHRGRPVAERALVTRHVQDGPDWWHLTLRVPSVAAIARPGQFLQVQVQPQPQAYDPLLPRPLSFCTLDAEHGEISLIYRVVGRGTALLARALPGTPLGVFGPLGQSFPDPDRGAGQLLLVGGGLGIPPLAAAAAWARARRPAAILGARRADDLAGQAQVAAATRSVAVCTEDGSAGTRGLVTDLLAPALSAGSEVWACGPMPMLASVAALCRARGAECWLALETPMACGFGVCMGCAVEAARGGYLKACTDGPVLPAEAVRWAASTTRGARA